ncbi:MAG TPA: zinc metalloprotease [Nocardioidaceae bacterium]|nr:zinc metalloprotease [Nocardioidaceae bacterium]
MSPLRTGRRGPRAAVLVATAAVLASSLVAASSAPAGSVASVAPTPADRACEPGAGHGLTAGSARLNRVDDQVPYTLRQLRRVDRRLHRALAQSTSGTGSARFGLTLRIPVRAHVIDGNHARGPSRRAVQRQVRVLNRAYDGGQSRHNTATRFRFYLASFDRVRNQRWYTASFLDRAASQLRRRLHEGGPESLNVYFAAPETGQLGSVVLGWSTAPWLAARRPRLDGVTVHQESMPGGDLTRYNRGDTTVHEVGHWLGLFHTFEGGCSPGNDRVDDTPAEATASVGCAIGRDTCEAGGLDPVRNFMDYSFDTCMNMFTPGQVARMTDNWLAYRTP